MSWTVSVHLRKSYFLMLICEYFCSVVVLPLLCWSLALLPYTVYFWMLPDTSEPFCTMRGCRSADILEGQISCVAAVQLIYGRVRSVAWPLFSWCTGGLDQLRGRCSADILEGQISCVAAVQLMYWRVRSVAWPLFSWCIGGSDQLRGRCSADILEGQISCVAAVQLIYWRVRSVAWLLFSWYTGGSDQLRGCRSADILEGQISYVAAVQLIYCRVRSVQSSRPNYWIPISCPEISLKSPSNSQLTINLFWLANEVINFNYEGNHLFLSRWGCVLNHLFLSRWGCVFSSKELEEAAREYINSVPDFIDNPFLFPSKAKDQSEFDWESNHLILFLPIL